MDKIKKLQMIAKILRQHHGYKYNKQSDFANRFNFKLDKENKCIDIYNDDKDADLFLWTEFIQLTDLFELSCYVHNETWVLKRVVFHIY